jgi:hypothetical protein
MNRIVTQRSLKLALVFAFALLGTTAMAQDYRGRIEGIVTDPSQAVIAGATVTLLNVNTGIHTVRQTSPTGLYLFDLVDPGSYAITVEAAGFGRNRVTLGRTSRV